MTTVTVTKDNFEQLVSGSAMVVLDFWASWCGPCRAFGPVFDKASDEHPDVIFGKVDTEAQPELAAAFQISSIPTLMILRDQVVLFAQPGALPKATLDQLIRDARALDMDQVRRAPADRKS